MRAPAIIVAAAVIERDDTFLMTRRLAGTHLAGCWEFPGGKLHEGESLEMCVVREVAEELGCTARVGRLIVSSTHHYPERTVTLHFFTCSLDGEPSPQDGQQMRWVARADLQGLELPDADRALVDLLTRG